MPPLCTPEKVPPHELSSISPEAGYITPPHSSCHTVSDNPKKDEEKRHIKWLLEKFSVLSDIFKIHGQIGEGTFSSVFKASLMNNENNEKLYAIKHLVPTMHPVRIEIELRCLKLIGGSENVVGLDLCLREHENVIFVMPYLEHDSFSEYYYRMDAKETAFFMKNLLKAVCHVHKFGIIHRDIKPNNFLYNRANKKFLLVDFGLAQVSSSEIEEIKTLPTETLKRKREPELLAINKNEDFAEPLRKRRALENKNVVTLTSTVHHLQITTSKGVTYNRASKENIPEEVHSQNSPLKIQFKSPLKSPFKSPKKKLPKLSRDSPYVIPTGKKLPGQRRLFDTSDDLTNEKLTKPTLPSTSKMVHEKKLSLQTNSKNVHVCKCFGKPHVCGVCLLRKPQEAPRAGTPGFRPPEVLLKYSNQTTAVDIWAIGVMLLCILSRTYPFFRAPDDLTALAEMITLFGTDNIKKIARKFGKQLTCSEKKTQLDLRKVCCILRTRGKSTFVSTDPRCLNCKQYLQNCLCIGTPMNAVEDIFPDSAYDLLKKLLDVNPNTRISADEALKHPFLADS